MRLIAEGGMGQVYEVKHVELGRRAALKVMRPELAQNEEMAARFFTEARAMSLVEHPALIHVYEYGHLDDGGAYIVMEYVEGKSLRELLSERGGKLAPLAAVGLARQVASALQAAHEKSIVHRDLKPDNIMFIEAEDESIDSRVKIIDFGVAKVLGSAGTEQKNYQTRPGQVLGTPMYMAPEQVSGSGAVGSHTDVYALGVLFFEMLTGKPPFDAEGAMQVIGKHMFSAPPRLGEVMPNADVELDALLNRMLSKTPENRPSMREVKRELGKINERVSRSAYQQRIANLNPDISQSETLVYRTAENTATTRVPELLPDRFRSLLKKPALLAGLLLLALILALGLWLLLHGPAARPGTATAPLPEQPAAKGDRASAPAPLPAPASEPAQPRPAAAQPASGKPPRSRWRAKEAREAREPKDRRDGRDAPAPPASSDSAPPRIVD